MIVVNPEKADDLQGSLATKQGKLAMRAGGNVFKMRLNIRKLECRSELTKLPQEKACLLDDND